MIDLDSILGAIGQKQETHKANEAVQGNVTVKTLRNNKQQPDMVMDSDELDRLVAILSLNEDISPILGVLQKTPRMGSRYEGKG